MKPFTFLLLTGLLPLLAYAIEDNSMEELLDTFTHNSDLSKKTKLVNAGNVTVITRKELDGMQARNLKDVIKTLPMMNYAESRWGIPDPNYHVQEYPLNSNAIRIYIDNQEVSSAPYGSGFIHMGDISIGFVDHIEIYSQNPSFEYATEPARLLIKLYSKKAKRDKGSKVELSLGSRGFNQESFQHTDSSNGVSYLIYGSRLDDKKETYKSFDTPMYRDQERYFFFSSISTKEHLLQFHALKNDKDMFIGLSTDAVSQKAKLKTERLHLGYENHSIKNLKLSAVLESGTLQNHYVANEESLEYDIKDEVFTLDAQYKYNEVESNELIIGTKLRYKDFSVPKIIFNQRDSKFNYNKQRILSFYLEDNYFVNDNTIITLGAQGSHVKNNFVVKDQDVWMIRAGLIYHQGKWISKTFLHHSSFLVEPYLYTLTGPYTAQNGVEPEQLSNISQEIAYENEKHKLRTILSYNYKEGALLVKKGRLQNKSSSESTLLSQTEYQYQFDIHNTFSSSFTYIHYRNPYKHEVVNGLDEYKTTLRLLNHHNKFDIFNELIHNKNSFLDRHYFDYSAGIKYHHNDKLILSLKGENILNRAREDYYERIRFNQSTENWDRFEPLYIAPIDRRIYLTMEYLF